MSEQIVKKRTKPYVVILDEAFSPYLTDGTQFGADETTLLAAARRIVGESLQSLEVKVHDVAYLVRVVRMIGPDPMRYAMFVEKRRARRPLLEALDRFGLTSRESDVLTLIVGGASNREIAETLSIVEATVQDHVRNICRKTGAKRRGDLLAKVFDVENL